MAVGFITKPYCLRARSKQQGSKAARSKRQGPTFFTHGTWKLWKFVQANVAPACDEPKFSMFPLI